MDAEEARIYLAAQDEDTSDEQLPQLTDDEAVRRANAHADRHGNPR